MPSRARDLAAAALVAAACVMPGAAAGQGTGPEPAPERAPERAPVLTINPERLFAETAFGLRVQAEIEEQGRALAAENRRIEAELIAEERDLTERRPALPVNEFRALADAFDAKVDRLRAEQDAKTRDLQRLREAEQQRFFGQIVPALSALVAERGASVVLDGRQVFLGLDSIDITDAAIARIDADIGNGRLGTAESDQ